MSKTSYMLIPPGYDELLNKGLKPGDRFTIPRICRSVRFLSLPRKKRLSQRSLLPQISEAWNLLTPLQQADWNAAGAVMNWSGWRLFVQDKAERIKLELLGNATPSLLHQSFVGWVHIEEPASGLTLEQPHPKFYWIKRKIRGTQSQYTLIKITEGFALPLVLGVNYKADLIDVTGSGYARYFALVRSLYQGRDIFTPCEILFSLQSDWTFASSLLAGVLGRPIAYTLFLEFNGVRGDFWFDDVDDTHADQNWARDPYCRQIRSSFTGAYFQVPRHWAAVELPDGADFDSTYFDG